MSQVLRALVVTFVLCSAGGSVHGQSSSPPAALPPGVFAAERDIALATAGTYTLDGLHTSVIARVSHLGYSYSIFRFDTVAGKLTWDPAAVEKSTLSASVETASITTNVKGFAEELAGDNFLKSKAFPQATFVSTAFRPTDKTRGKVDGRLTLMGKTKEVTFDVELVGAGKGFGGNPRIGVHGATSINPQDFGMMPLFTTPIEIVIDTEFQRNP
jgi:polyisoprenoid-binding protein YceI